MFLFLLLTFLAELPGPQSPVGPGPDAKRVKQLVIAKPGIYENYLVDGEWSDSTLVKIQADGVTLRRCEIRNGRHNAVTVYAKDTVIEQCKIHHALAGSFKDQKDAHGITGRPTNLVVRHCDIGLCSGDAIQFDPGRGVWGDATIEHCRLWTGPLPADAADFRRGERPGENGVDTKQKAANPRSKLAIRHCVFEGWNQPGPISNMAAVNLKDHVEVSVADCVFRDNEICFRVRGGSGERGGAKVTIDNCAVYDSKTALRAEDKIVDLKIRRLGFGDGIQRKVQIVGGVGPGFEQTGDYTPPAFEAVLKEGLPK